MKPVSDKMIKSIIKDVRAYYDVMFHGYNGVGKVESDKAIEAVIKHFDKLYKEEVLPDTPVPLLSSDKFLESKAYELLLFSKTICALVDNIYITKVKRLFDNQQKDLYKEQGGLLQ